MWKVKELDLNDGRTKSKLDRFFDSQTKTQSLVREVIQNSLDAKKDDNKPVEVSFDIEKISSKDLNKYLLGHELNLEEHLNKCGINVINKESRYLRIQDFNTNGLTGEIDQTKFNSNGEPVESNFIGFWWSEGISQKGRGSGGSHGVGKIKLSTSSQYNFFLAETIRSDDGKKYLLGYCQLKWHPLKKKQFKSDVRYGRISNERLLPYDFSNESDEKIIKQFEADFSITRNNKDGLSIVIPNIYDEINFENIVKSSINEFYIPILRNDLILKISENDSNVIISRDTIEEIAKKYLPKKESEIINGSSKMLSAARGKVVYLKTESEFGTSSDIELSEKDFHTDDLEYLRNKFDQGEILCAVFPVTIRKKDNGKIVDVKTRFTVFIENNEFSILHREVDYVRSNIKINKERSKPIKPFSQAMLLIDDVELSEYLKYAEDPGHEKWQYNTLNENIKENDDYVNDEALRIIKSTLKEYYNVIVGEKENQKIEGILPEIFNIIDKEPTPGGGGGSPKPKPKPQTKKITIISLTQSQFGFKLKNSSSLKKALENGLLSIPFKLRIVTGYVESGSKGVKYYDELDYDLAEPNFDIKISGANKSKITKNEIVVSVISNEFQIECEGFDENRDLEIIYEVN